MQIYGWLTSESQPGGRTMIDKETGHAADEQERSMSASVMLDLTQYHAK